MHCFQRSHPTVTSSISARPLEGTLMSSGSTLSRAALRVVPLIRGLPHPTSYLCHRRMGVQQGRDHLIDPRSHRRGIIDRGIISARGRTNETVTNSGRLKISSELIDAELPPRSSALSFVDGRFNKHYNNIWFYICLFQTQIWFEYKL